MIQVKSWHDETHSKAYRTHLCLCTYCVSICSNVENNNLAQNPWQRIMKSIFDEITTNIRAVSQQDDEDIPGGMDFEM